LKRYCRIELQEGPIVRTSSGQCYWAGKPKKYNPTNGRLREHRSHLRDEGATASFKIKEKKKRQQKGVDAIGYLACRCWSREGWLKLHFITKQGRAGRNSNIDGGG